MEISKNSIIGELVANDYRTASVFKNYNIDFCCNGNRSIDEACSKQQLDRDKLISDLSLISKATGGEKAIDYNTWPLDSLADYIEKKHHQYVDEKISEIKPYINKIATVHGKSHPELIEVEQLFIECANQLTMHMKKEELMLFPAIRKMVTKGSEYTAPHFGSIQNPINQMNVEHDAEGERFRRIAELTNNYTIPEDGCNTYRVTLLLLQEFEEDLHLHIHLENNILFPKAIELEKQLSNA
jgi:regulator of cell morphogenesis and NO signaling